MYIPKYFQNKNIDEIRGFINEYSFGILVSQTDHKPVATHIPMLLDKNEHGKDILTSHVSRANPHHKLFIDNAAVLAMFLGPHAYVSSGWYSHENVPTWNYIAVHIYGTIKVIEGDRLLRQLGLMVDKYEAGSKNPVSLGKMTHSYLKKELGAIVGFEIKIEEIQAAYKLSQNRNEHDYENVIHELEKRGDPGSVSVADAMKKRKQN